MIGEELDARVIQYVYGRVILDPSGVEVLNYAASTLRVPASVSIHREWALDVAAQIIAYYRDHPEVPE